MGIHMNKSQRMCLLLIGALVIFVAAGIGLCFVDVRSYGGFQVVPDRLDYTELLSYFLAVPLVVLSNVMLLIGYGIRLVRTCSVFAVMGDAIALLLCGGNLLWIFIPSVRPGVYLEYQVDFVILAVLIFLGVAVSLYVAIKGLVDPDLSYGGPSQSMEADVQQLREEVQQLRAEIDELKERSPKA